MPFKQKRARKKISVAGLGRFCLFDDAAVQVVLARRLRTRHQTDTALTVPERASNSA